MAYTLPHRARREQDEFVCTRCAKRWDVNEKEPPCLGLGELDKAQPIVKSDLTPKYSTAHMMKEV